MVCAKHVRQAAGRSLYPARSATARRNRSVHDLGGAASVAIVQRTGRPRTTGAWQPDVESDPTASRYHSSGFLRRPVSDAARAQRETRLSMEASSSAVTAATVQETILRGVPWRGRLALDDDAGTLMRLCGRR